MQLLYLDRKFTLYTLSVMDLVVGNSKNSWLTDLLIYLFIYLCADCVDRFRLTLFIYLPLRCSSRDWTFKEQQSLPLTG